MQELKNWDSLQSFFSTLNENVEYLVLRNYEELLEGLTNVEHPDIDILCRDSKKLIHFTKSSTRTGNKRDFIHQQIKIAGKLVSLDVRHVGDGYYDKKWENDMLSKRRLIQGLCYVMDDENYYYSLLYHALIQKYSMSKDYEEKLKSMAGRLFDKLDYSPTSLELLQHYMRQKSYHFTYPEYIKGIANFDKVDKDLIQSNPMRNIRRLTYRIMHRITSEKK